MLVNVEQGATNPSIATLLRLADALGIGLPTLVDPGPDEAPAVVVRRNGDMPAVWTSDAGGAAVMVAGAASPDVAELWDWRLGPGDHHTSEAHRSGTRELLQVRSGALILVVADAEHRLGAGDSASFEGSVPHAYRNASASRAVRFTLAVYEPASSRES
jgi:hypothetical protein